jgi:hypothetical protein
MVRNPEKYEQFERGLIAGKKPDYAQNLRIAEALYEEAVHLGIWPPKDPLEGIEVSIRIARILNSVRSTS